MVQKGESYGKQEGEEEYETWSFILEKNKKS
jgi:hypothetical protein